MWGTVVPNTNNKWEPIELQILKKELANLNCNCTACESSRDTDSHHSDAAIQVDSHNNSLDRHDYGHSNSSTCHTEEQYRTNLVECFRNDIFCPNCYFIWDLLRRFTKVFKDEECETAPNMFSSDKATDNKVDLVDSTTSVTHKATVKLSSALVLCDFISDSSLNAASIHPKLKNHNDRVKFTDDYENNTNYLKNLKKDLKAAPMQGYCFCLENYIDAIRPPLPN